MNCDKCNLPVDKRDSATWLIVYAGEMSAMELFMCHDRHIKCSPSRAQYIPELGIMETREQYDKLKRDAGLVHLQETLYTDAYHRLQAEKTESSLDNMNPKK